MEGILNGIKQLGSVANETCAWLLVVAVFSGKIQETIQSSCIDGYLDVVNE